MLGAKELAIAWGAGDTPQYWFYRGCSDSRFAEVAELRLVWWLEIRGKLEIKLLSPNTFYVAYLAKVEVVGRDGCDTSACSKERLIYLCDGNEHSPPDPLETEYFARERGDGWMEVEMGHFYNGGGVSKVHMSVLETERGVPKRGLIVQGMELRPKVDTNELPSRRSTSRSGRRTRGGRASASSFTYASTSQASTGLRGGRGSRERRGGRRGRGLVQ
ncbi:hypothetical protein MKW98_027170 [Papaver atlanticum]|uniref:Uncharacterized protein n=1 Tax=Papaver atlanticum TaxID=357466 RepID=A0AAD4XR48_9MAGN|nr:hypothetical protein MKW98_027170 [Papaver atlanticum]